MELVKEGFLSELATALELGETDIKESQWWLGRLAGLHEAGALTEEEHDEVSSKTIKMLAAAKTYNEKTRDNSFRGDKQDG